MARKMSRNSVRKKISQPSINRKKDRAFTKKLIRLNNRKVVSTTVTRLSEKKGRRTVCLQNDKLKQKSRKKGVIHDNSISVFSEITRMKHPRVSVTMKEIKNDMLHSFDCGISGIATKTKNVSVDKPNNELVENQISTTLTTGLDDNEQEQASTATNDFPKSWTEEMIRYYFEPNEECKNFDHVRIMNNIKYKASDWRISDADRMECRKRKEFFLRCAKCNQKGHSKKECKKNVVCYMCGEFNHWYSECPNALCFSCGRATKKFINNCRQCCKILSSRRSCTLCGQVWHEEELCPSKWRKYLMVTRTTRKSAIRLNKKKCCYNCAQRGHFGFECPLVLQSEYPPDNPLKTAFPLKQRNQDDNGDSATDYYNYVDQCSSENSPHTSSNDNLDLPHVHVIFLAKQTSDVLSTESGKCFLANLSHNTNIRIELFCGKQSYIKLFGDDDIVNYCKCELLKWKIS